MKIKTMSIFSALALALGMLVSTSSYSWHYGWGHGYKPYGGYYYGFGHPRWSNAYYYPGGAGVIINPIVYPYGKCFVPGHYNRWGYWIPAHRRC